VALSWAVIESRAERDRAWDEVAGSCGYATFFHTRAWAEVFCAGMGDWEDETIAIEFSDGNLGVLPLLRHVDSGHRQSTAPFVYGGPLFLAPPDDEHMGAVGKIPRWFDDIVLYDNPFSPYSWHQEGLVRWRIHTHALDLGAGFDAIFAGTGRSLRRLWRNADRTGVSVTLASTLQDVDEYYEAYLDSVRRWGDTAISHYPRELFHALFELQEDGRGVRLWVGIRDGRVVSGVLVLHQGAHCVSWQAATHSEHLRSRASGLVYLSAIRTACEEGLRWFDFNPSGKLRGVELFKESFGAKRLPFDMYHSAAFSRLADFTPARTVARVESQAESVAS
jgi:Acetyltransferase (GNAT) domain